MDALTLARHELWRRGAIAEMLLHSGQREIYDNINALPQAVKEVAVCISRRWGKTYLGVVMALEKALSKPNSQVIICAPTAKQAANIIVPLVRQIIQSAPEGLIKQLKSELRWRCSNGSLLVMGGFDTASESFRGLFADLCIVEEGGASNADNFEYIVKSILLPLLLSTNGKIVHFFTPAELPDHPIHIDTMPRCEANGALFRYDIHSCPIYTTNQIAEMCEAVGGEHSVSWQREFLVRVTKDTAKLCVPEFDETLHAQAFELPEFCKYWIAVDIGGVRDMTSVQLYGYEHRQNKMLCIAERVYKNNTSTSVIVEGIQQLRGDKQDVQVWADAPGQLRIDLSRDFGLSCAFPNKDEFHASISQVREGFRLNQILVHPDCKHLITTLKNATYNSSRTDFLRTETLGHADSLACLIYGWRHRNLSSPFPTQAINPETHWLRPDRRHTSNLQAAAHALNPYAAKRKKQ